MIAGMSNTFFYLGREREREKESGNIKQQQKLRGETSGAK